MRLGKYLRTAMMLSAACGFAGCGRDIGPVDSQTLSAVAQPVVEASPTTADGEAGTPREGAGPGSGLALGEESLTLGLLAPSLPGLTLGTYSSVCDPFEDSLGSCL